MNIILSRRTGQRLRARARRIQHRADQTAILHALTHSEGPLDVTQLAAAAHIPAHRVPPALLGLVHAQRVESVTDDTHPGPLTRRVYRRARDAR